MNKIIGLLKFQNCCRALKQYCNGFVFFTFKLNFNDNINILKKKLFLLQCLENLKPVHFKGDILFPTLITEEDLAVILSLKSTHAPMSLNLSLFTKLAQESQTPKKEVTFKKEKSQNFGRGL